MTQLQAQYQLSILLDEWEAEDVSYDDRLTALMYLVEQELIPSLPKGE